MPYVQEQKRSIEVFVGMVIGCVFGVVVLLLMGLMYVALPLLGAVVWIVIVLPALLGALLGVKYSLSYLVLYIFGVGIGGPFVFGLIIGALSQVRRRGRFLEPPSTRLSVPAPVGPRQRSVRRIIINADTEALPANLRSLVREGTPIILEEDCDPHVRGQW